jgi:phage shock protein C
MRKLYRSEADKILFGVCGGLAEYFGVESVLVRLVFVLFSIMGGGGLVLYLVLALVIPRNPAGGADGDAKEKIKDFAHKAGETIGDLAKEIGHGAKATMESVKTERRRSSFFGIILIIAGALLIVNQIMPAYWMMGRRFFWPALLMLVGIYLILWKPERVAHPREHSREKSE